MALSFALTEAGHPPGELKVTASVDISKADGSFLIRPIALDALARVPGIHPEQSRTLAESSKAGCSVSKALAAIPPEVTDDVATG